MKLRLLGTGAADGIPGLYPDNRVSEYARAHRGKDVRTRAAAIVDDHLKLDLSPETALQLLANDLRASDWSGLVFTHSHDDHFALNELQYLLYPFCAEEFVPFPIYGNATIVAELREQYGCWPMEFIETRSFETFTHLGYEITPVHAHHKLEEDSHNLIVSHEGASLLYATDTGVWLDDTWAFLAGRLLSALVIECTEGMHRTGYYGHMSIDECIEVVRRLREMGTLAGDAPVVTTHHSHLGDLTHAELEDLLAPHGMQPGFDGMAVTVPPLG